MSSFDSILLALDGSLEAAKAVGCAVWLSARLGATLHVLHAGESRLMPEDAMKRLRAAEAQRAHVVLHQSAAPPERALLEAIERHSVKLVVMSARGESVSADPRKTIGRVAQAVLARTSVPSLLIPLRYREALPWSSMLIATSGEEAADQALRWAVQLSHALDVKATVAFVEAESTAEPGRLADYADAPHHEIPARLGEMVQRAITSCTLEECTCIDEVVLRRGDPATELLGQLERRGSSVLAVGWHGAFGGARALVLTRLLDLAERPLLVIRERVRPSARLKVGDEIG